MVIDQCNSRQCTQFILPTFDNWREWLILLQSTRMVDSDICIDKIGWFYPNRESTFWTMHAILKLQVPILAMRNNKMGHRINKMWTLINKVGHRNVKLVDTYQQLVFKKQQNGSRVLYPSPFGSNSANVILPSLGKRSQLDRNCNVQCSIVRCTGWCLALLKCFVFVACQVSSSAP